MEVYYQEIIINWQEKSNIDSIDDYKFDTNVLYQIYGDHHIYGRDTLLYIGKSINYDNRFKSHINGVFGFANNITFSVGYIKDFNDKLEIPESILIANHKPSYNKEFIHDLPPEAKTKKIIVINNGVNYMLKTCCTNYWWVN